MEFDFWREYFIRRLRYFTVFLYDPALLYVASTSDALLTRIFSRFQYYLAKVRIIHLCFNKL